MFILERIEHPLVKGISEVAKIILEKLHFAPPSYHLIACFEAHPSSREICSLSNGVTAMKGPPLTYSIRLTAILSLDPVF